MVARTMVNRREEFDYLQAVREATLAMNRANEYDAFLGDNWETSRPRTRTRQENQMTEFELNLNTNSLKFGSVAEGQTMDVEADIQLSSKLGNMPFSGIIKGSYVGEVKGTKSIPLTVAHKAIGIGRRPINIIIIGAGGTGGYVIRDLGRVIYALKEKGDVRPITIKIVDGDIVEKKNILRQNFAPGDLGKPKAVVAARRYSSAFGVEFQAVQKMIESVDDVYELATNESIGDQYPVNIIVGCIDNNKARRVIRDSLNGISEPYWIDSGNEKKSGQVVCGYKRDSYRFDIPERNTKHWLPNVIDLYPEVGKESEDVIEDVSANCADRAAEDTQSIFINMTAAGHVLGYIRQIIMEEPITINRIEFNVKGVTEVSHITEEYLKKSYDQRAA